MSPMETVKGMVAESGKKHFGLFCIILLGAVANWGLSLGQDITFVEILTPFRVFSFLAVIGTTGSAYYLKSPKKTN